MKKTRIIPVLLLKNGFLIQSRGFSRYQNLGNPTSAVRRLTEWMSDELIYIDISKDDTYDMKRNDIFSSNHSQFSDIVKDVAKECQIPFTLGGKIRTLKDIEQRLSLGADKVSINTKALESPSFITEAAKEFGSQCLIISMDVEEEGNQYRVMKNGGKIATPYTDLEWAKIVEDAGAGEILLNSIDRDGRGEGYDIKLLKQVSESVNLPIIALGGVGEWSDFKEALEETQVDAVAAANIFHHRDQSVYLARQYLYTNNFNVRKPELFGVKI